MVDINFTLLAQIFNFLLLVAVVSWFGYKPLVKVMDERRNKIATDLANAEAAKAAAGKIKEEYEAQLSNARVEAQEIIDRANKSATEAYNQMLVQAKEEQERIFKSAQEKIEREKVNALMEVRAEVVSLSMALAEKVVEKKLDKEADQKIINEFLDEITNKPGGLPC